MAKEYLNPVAVAEQGIAEFIAELPELSGLFGGKVYVFAGTDESAAKLLRAKILQGLKQCVVVAFTGTSEAAPAPRLPAKATFAVSVFSPGLLAEQAPRATTDLASAIVRALHGTQFGEPFVARMPVRLVSWTQEADADGKLCSRLEFEAGIFLTNE